MEGVYWISLFEIFGFNRPAFQLCSFLLAAGGCLLMGMTLAKAFPRRMAFVSTAVLFAFFLPTISPLTYVMATDNSRLSLLLFWACVLAYQRWAGGRTSWHGLLGPWLLYGLAFCTYEAASFLLFTVPLLVFPVWQRGPQAVSRRAFGLRLAVGILGSFTSVVLIRFLVLQGGAVAQSSLFPSWDLLWSYPALLPFYLLAPFTYIPTQPWVWVGSLLVMLGTGIVLAMCFASEGAPASKDLWYKCTAYTMALGAIILVFGMLPYQLAGYGGTTPSVAETASIKWGMAPAGFAPWFNFNWSSRIYSAGSYGVAILLASVLTAWTRSAAKITAAVVAAVCIGIMASFHMGLSEDWKEAARVRNQLIASLVSQVPDVTPHTNFLFLDLECSQGRAPVFRGWNGLRELVRMIYSRNDLGAWYVYPYSWKWPNHLFHQAIVSPDGFVSRAMDPEHPVGHDSVIILRRSGSRLILVDRITAGDGLVPTGINWEGTRTLHSNPDRIRGWWDEKDSVQKPPRNAWETGFITSVGLERIPWVGLPKNFWGSQGSIGPITKVTPGK